MSTSTASALLDPALGLWLSPTGLLIALVFALAGFVKGVIGLGLPTIAMGLLSLRMPPAQAAALLIVPSLLSNVWQMRGPGLAALSRRLAPMLLGVCVGTALGAGWLTGAGSPLATAALGLALVAYAALGLAAPPLRLAPRHEPWAGPGVGVATGLVTAGTGVFVIPAVPYLQALGLQKDALVQALGLSFLVSTLALAASLGGSGALPAPTALASLGAVLPVLAGMALGQVLRSRLAPALFKRAFFIGLIALGLHLVWQHRHALAGDEAVAQASHEPASRTSRGADGPSAVGAIRPATGALPSAAGPHPTEGARLTS